MILCCTIMCDTAPAAIRTIICYYQLSIWFIFYDVHPCRVQLLYGYHCLQFSTELPTMKVSTLASPHDTAMPRLSQSGVNSIHMIYTIYAVLWLVFTWSPHPWFPVEITPVLTTFLWILPLCALLLCSMTHYDITMGHDVVRGAPLWNNNG